MQLTCPNCGSSNLKGSLLVETNVQVVNTIVSNPATGTMKIRRGDHQYTDETGVALICSSCDTESRIPNEDVSYDLAKK